MKTVNLDPRMMLLSLFREAKIDRAVLIESESTGSVYLEFYIRPHGYLRIDDPVLDSASRSILGAIERVMIENDITEFSRFSSGPPEPPLTVEKAIEKLKVLPKDAEFRVTECGACGITHNVPARDIVFERIGPMIYVEVI